MRETEALSDRELEVLRLVATGATNDQIARQLAISTNTVKVHLRNIFSKLGVASRTEASLCAIRKGWVTLGPGTVSTAAGGASPSTEAAAEAPLPRKARTWLRALLLAGALLLILALAFSMTDLPRRWIFPGQASPSAVASAQVQRWTTRAAMSTARSDLALVPFGGLLYAIGGRGSRQAGSAVERFNPVNDSWETLASKPTAVSGAGGAVLGGRIYVPGGLDEQGRLTAVTEAYEIERNGWITVAPLPRPLSAYALVAFEGNLYLFGGWDGNGYRDEILRYDPEANRWEEAGKLPFSWGQAGAVVADNRIMLLGGVSTNGPVNVILEYSPALGTRETLPLPGILLGQVRATALLDFLYVLAQPETQSPSHLWQYNVSTQKWQEIEPPSAGLHTGTTITAIGTKLFLVGGEEQGNPLPSTHEYQALFVIPPPVYP